MREKISSNFPIKIDIASSVRLDWSAMRRCSWGVLMRGVPIFTLVFGVGIGILSVYLLLFFEFDADGI